MDHEIEILQKIANKLKSIYHQEFVVDAQTTRVEGDMFAYSYTDMAIVTSIPDTSFVGVWFKLQKKVTVLSYEFPACGIFDWNENYPEVKALFDELRK